MNHASTEPSFFTTDKRRVGGVLRRSSARFNGAVVLHDGQDGRTGPRAWPSDCFNGAVVLHDGQVQTSRRSRTGMSSFNGAVVLHDGQVRCLIRCCRSRQVRFNGGVFAEGWRRLAVASTEPSFFTTDKPETHALLPSTGTVLQRSRRSSRRTRLACRIAPPSAPQLQRSRRSSRRTSRHF